MQRRPEDDDQKREIRETGPDPKQPTPAEDVPRGDAEMAPKSDAVETPKPPAGGPPAATADAAPKAAADSTPNAGGDTTPNEGGDTTPGATTAPASGAGEALPDRKPAPDVPGAAKPAAGSGEPGAAPAAAKPPPGPSFARDPGLEEAPTAAEPAAGTFTADPAAKLPAKEPQPDLSFLNADKPWWGDATAKAFAEKLADTYASRGLTTGKPVERAAKLTELQGDFDDVIRGWLFGRTKFQVVWNEKMGGTRLEQLPVRMASLLEAKRATILRELKTADAKLPKDKRRSSDDLDAALEGRMQKERFDLIESLRRNVALATWGWMAERREKLDFDTIKQKRTGADAKLAELLTNDEQRALVRGILDQAKKGFSDEQKAKIVERAQAARNAAAKKAKKEPAEMTDDEKASAIAQAELDRLRELNLGGKLRRAMIEARTTKDAANLMVPTRGDVKGWDTSNSVRIHKDVVALLKRLEAEFPAGFRAATYMNDIEGDHASGGFEGRFRSLDMYPNEKARPKGPFGDAGFFGQQTAYDFAMAIDRAVEGAGHFQILYNDFPVARELNKVLKNGHVVNIDNVNADKGGAKNLNWHGPLVTHFHVDFAI